MDTARRILLGAALVVAAWSSLAAVEAVDDVHLLLSHGAAVEDQGNLTSTGNFVVNHQQHVGQSFTVGVAGTLRGIEFAPLRDTAGPSDLIYLDLYGASGLLGTVSITAAGFPPGAGNVPGPLAANAIGPGYFDLSALGIMVSAGQILSFELRPGFDPGVCTSNTCTSGQIGRFCFDDLECEKACRAGSSGDNYVPGTATINGVAFPIYDLAFKTVVLQSEP